MAGGFENRWPTRENMVNPYESPSNPCYIPARHEHVGTGLLCVVLFNVGGNALKVLRNWPELTLGLFLVGALLWFVLPTLAAFLLWRRWKIGRWILVGLFGLLVVMDLGCLGPYLSFALKTGDWGLLVVMPSRIVEILVYVGATAWLSLSPGIRGLCTPVAAPGPALSTIANKPQPHRRRPLGDEVCGRMVE